MSLQLLTLMPLSVTGCRAALMPYVSFWWGEKCVLHLSELREYASRKVRSILRCAYYLLDDLPNTQATTSTWLMWPQARSDIVRLTVTLLDVSVEILIQKSCTNTK